LVFLHSKTSLIFISFFKTSISSTYVNPFFFSLSQPNSLYQQVWYDEKRKRRGENWFGKEEKANILRKIK